MLSRGAVQHIKRRLTSMPWRLIGYSTTRARRRNPGTGVGSNKSTLELATVVTANQLGAVLGAAVAYGQQLFKHDRYLDPIGSGK